MLPSRKTSHPNHALVEHRERVSYIVPVSSSCFPRTWISTALADKSAQTAPTCCPDAWETKEHDLTQPLFWFPGRYAGQAGAPATRSKPLLKGSTCERCIPFELKQPDLTIICCNNVLLLGFPALSAEKGGEPQVITGIRSHSQIL